VSAANARDEWRQATLAADGKLEVAQKALGAAAARYNHAAAEGVSYA
jgi:hypothetical protein